MDINKKSFILKEEITKIFKFLEKLDSPKFISLPNNDSNEDFLNFSIAIKKLEESRHRYIRRIKSEILSDKFYRLVSKELISLSSKNSFYQKKTLEKMIIDALIDLIIANNHGTKKDFYPKAARESIDNYKNRIIKKIKKNNLKAIDIKVRYIKARYILLRCYIEIIDNEIIPTFVPLDFFPMDNDSLGYANTYKFHLTPNILKAISTVVCDLGERLTTEYLHENKISLECIENIERFKKDRDYADIDINKSIAVCSDFIKGFSKFSEIEIGNNYEDYTPNTKTDIISDKLSPLSRGADKQLNLEDIGSPLFASFSYSDFINEIHRGLRGYDGNYMTHLRGCSDIALSPFILPERYTQFNKAAMSFKQSILDGLDESKVKLKKKNKLKDFNDLMEAELDNFYNGEILEDLKKGKSLSEVNDLNEKEVILYCKSRLNSYPKLEIERIRKKISKYYIKNEKRLTKNEVFKKRRHFSKEFEVYINKNLSKEISLYAMTNALINENHFLYEYEPYNQSNIKKIEETIIEYESEKRKQNKNQDLIENCINELRLWISLERQLPMYSSTQRSLLSHDKSFSNIYGKFMPSDFFKLKNVYNQKGKYSNKFIKEAKKHIEQFINFIHLNPESTSDFFQMFHIARRHYLEKYIKEKNLYMGNVFESDLLLGEEARFWDLLLIFVQIKSSVLSRTFLQDICGTLIRAILFIEGIYAYGGSKARNLYSMAIGELDNILPVFDAHIDSISYKIHNDDSSLDIPIGMKFFSWQIREAVLDLRNYISAMEDVNLYDLPEPSYNQAKNLTFEQVLLFSKNKRESYIKNISDLRKYIDKRKAKNKNNEEKKDYQRYAQIRNGGLKSEYHGRINRKEAKKWLKNRSGIRKLKDLYIDNELDYLIGFIDYEEICSRR